MGILKKKTPQIRNTKANNTKGPKKKKRRNETWVDKTEKIEEKDKIIIKVKT